ncbi:YycH family regulatory protein [Paenibacillus radicis (ex Xue et al. 2023)]|uniref:Two-component system activity regulator YycH n=1 Tax=Paenibacillus radicis (ex Xue et al. 2023) TaxID=2972489 RepID=A0ABT1YQ33_9BACL|nr:two-component system activity regulator YycH [Paenibacillus radicis (ex Xue et al. 2023)]MCR8634850.1 two-component system activity regulator YycH [Paenibacillus radicis (ex Xue et al. 2023)]
MIEKLKSVVLVLLVGLSLLQSYYLSYSSPKFDPLVQEEYVKTEPIGTQAMLEELLFPDQVVLHLGNQQHTVLYPATDPYKRVVENVKQRSLEGFRKTTPAVLGLNWDEIRNKQQGIEVRFRDGIPINVLQRVMQLKGELPPDNDVITRVWIFTKESKDDVRTVLFTDTFNTMYEVVKSDISAKDIERFVSLEGILPKEEIVPYKLAGDDYYLPLKPIDFPTVRMPFTQYTVDQLKRSFFVDPAITRKLSERDGSEIYTDTKRGLKLKNDQRWMTYTDPIAPVDSKEDLRDNLLSAVQFVNQHGGWNGKYAVYKVPQKLLPSNQAFVFRQYYMSLPIMNQRSDNIGFIKIVMQKGIVASYERSMIIPDLSKLSSKELTLSSGEILDAKLNQYSKKSSVISVFPGYRPVIGEQTMDLVPVWTVELRDGTYEFLE